MRHHKATRATEWLEADVDEAAARFHQYVGEGYRLSMPRRSLAGGHRPAYWWIAEIADKRKACIAKCRVYHRRGRRDLDRDRDRLEYNMANKELRTLIRKSQERAWNELVAKVEGDVWGLPYRLVTKKLARGPTEALTRGKKVDIAKHLFPAAAPTVWEEIALTGPGRLPIPYSGAVHISPFHATDLARAALKLPCVKSPGPDLVHNEILKTFAREDPEALLALYNLCWGAAAFPSAWKRARLVLLYKGGPRSPDDLSSYRTISLINTTAKLFERLVLYVLEAEFRERGGLSTRQFGFRKGVGTAYAIKNVIELAEEDLRRRDRRTRAVVSLDVKNAFNTAAWPAIDEALRRKGL